MSNGPRQYLHERPIPGRQINWSHPLSYKLAGCWLLNDVGYRGYDLAKNNHGTLKNFNSPPNRSTLGTIFDSSISTYIDLNQVIYPLTNQKFTISAWYKSTSTVTGDMYSECNNTSNPQIIRLCINGQSSGDAQFGIRDNSSTLGSVTVDTNSNDGKWHHMAGVQANNSLRRLYFDGVLIGTNTTTIGNITSNNSKIGFQQRLLSESYFTGTIGNVMVYQRALSSYEAKLLYINPYSMFM